jgi:hypothetical protein
MSKHQRSLAPIGMAVPKKLPGITGWLSVLCLGNWPAKLPSEPLRGLDIVDPPPVANVGKDMRRHTYARARLRVRSATSTLWVICLGLITERLEMTQCNVTPKGGTILNIESSFLLDHSGEVHLEATAYSGSVCIDEREAGVLSGVKDNGQVEWRVRDGHVRLRFRPSLVSPATYARVMAWLTCNPPQRVMLSYFVEGCWQYEYLRRPLEAARRFRWLVELYGGGGNCNARRRSRPISSVLQQKGWRPATEFWKEHRVDLDPPAAVRAFNEFFSGRWILYACEPDSSFSVFDFGNNHAAYMKKWLRTRRNAPIADPLDSVFSQSCSRIYQSVVEGSEPRTDETDVISHWTGYGRRRAGFRRLMLPFRSAGHNLVLSGIQMDTSIDLLE